MKWPFGSRAVTVALTMGMVWCATALFSHFKNRALRTNAEYLLIRGDAEAATYSQTFDGAVYEQQLQTFEQRRSVLEKTFFWQRLQIISVLGAVLTVFCGYVLFLLHRLREQLVDAVVESEAEAG